MLQWLGAGLEAQQLMEEIRSAGRAISDIVRAVKSYAYLDQAPVQDVDLRTSLEDTLMILNHKIKHGIEVVKDFPPDLPRVEAYAGELNQVWTNLVDNAIQAMDGAGRLELCARSLGQEVEIRIADSGSGIPPDVAPRIFEPFFTTKAQGVGTGLGLHIAHNIVVNHHKGRISFETRPGRTEFRIVLPTRLSDRPEAANELGVLSRADQPQARPLGDPRRDPRTAGSNPMGWILALLIVVSLGILPSPGARPGQRVRSDTWRSNGWTTWESWSPTSKRRSRSFASSASSSRGGPRSRENGRDASPACAISASRLP